MAFQDCNLCIIVLYPCCLSQVVVLPKFTVSYKSPLTGSNPRLGNSFLFPFTVDSDDVMAPILDSLCHVQAFCSFCCSLFSLHSGVVLVENHGPRNYHDSAVLVVIRKLSDLYIGRMLQ